MHKNYQKFYYKNFLIKTVQNHANFMKKFFLKMGFCLIYIKLLPKSNLNIFKGVNGQYVWFCVDQPCLKDYYVFFDPFVWIAQYICAEDFIIMPIWAFIKMASGQDPDVIISLFPSEACTICI